MILRRSGSPFEERNKAKVLGSGGAGASANDLCEVENFLTPEDGEAYVKIIPEFEAVLGACLEESKCPSENTLNRWNHL